MSKWLLRGLVFAALMVIVRLLQGAMINVAETKAGLISVCLVAAYIVVVFVVGFLDGRSDARANPDPDRRGDLAMTWLLAGLVAGIVSGLVAWFISLFYKGLYVEALVNEVTTFAAFTALLVFLVAMAGVAIGRYLVDRKAPEVPHHRSTHDDDRADTDVFAAVNPGGQDTAPTTTDGGGTERADRGDNRS
ncbi:B-4DMT family transporter [Mycobacterium sp. IDR2000157661]|uniref:B-4DMT family transporter n=1 Tax=Mycobacterium sp. IDR2000157661 TaxID=2867005 RepID=UPI001EEBD999|nr:B-4DMT family transporter [Mycobacterium sp. IDR2000157661]ULE32776.1 B-4DMT family transporter [Mycobacterium sp. IDR2000157661]